MLMAKQSTDISLPERLCVHDLWISQ